MGSSQTRARTCAPFIGRRILNHWTTREVPIQHSWLILDLGGKRLKRALWGKFFLKIYIYLFIWLRQVLVAACELLVAACGIQFPNQGLNSGPLHWERAVLLTGPPGKSQRFFFLKRSLILYRKGISMIFLGFKVLICKLNQVNTKTFLQPNKSRRLKKPFAGTSLVVQWLRLHTSTPRGYGFNPWLGN